MNCTNCGSVLNPGIAFCTNCGAKAASPAPVPEAVAPVQVTGDGYAITERPSFSVLTLYLRAGESVLAESGAMVAMSANVDLQSQMKGGMMGALKRAVVGESLFQSTFTAQGAPGELLLAPSMPGDIQPILLRGQTYLVQSSSYLASDISLQMDTKWGGMKTFFSKEGLFMIKITGEGRLFVSSFGAIVRKTLAPGERYVVDTGHIVAFESTVQYTLRKASTAGWFRSMTSGEGIVAEYSGPGEIYLQTRNVEAFVGWMMPFFPKQSSGGGGGFSVNLGS